MYYLRWRDNSEVIKVLNSLEDELNEAIGDDCDKVRFCENALIHYLTCCLF